MNTIWLIVEGRKDAAIVRALLKKRYPQVRVRELKPSNPNISRLAQQIELLILQAKKQRQRGDCIAVLHDADRLSRPTGRQDYEKIKSVCDRYAQEVALIVATDEIEAWLLADPGLAAWLNQRAANYDALEKPSERLASWLDQASKPKYRIDQLEAMLQHAEGTGDQFSPSLRDAFAHLLNAPCVRIVHS